MFTLAHLSDPHLDATSRVRLRHFLGKRALGYLSWNLRKQALHHESVLAALVADLHRARPDHIAITGDLTNLSLPAEFLGAGAWLRRLGHPASVTAVPGNHDAYAKIAWERSLGLWADFMTGDRGNGMEQPPRSRDDFPFIRERGDIALVGVSTGLPTAIHSAAGRVGEKQLSALAGRLSELGRRGCFRIVLIHHPPVRNGLPKRKRLLDSRGFAAVVAEHGAELILHGHTHSWGMAWLRAPQGPALVLGVPSASASPDHGGCHAGYQLCRIARNEVGWQLEVEVRGVTARLDRIAVEERLSLSVPYPRICPTRAGSIQVRRAS